MAALRSRRCWRSCERRRRRPQHLDVWRLAGLWLGRGAPIRDWCHSKSGTHEFFTGAANWWPKLLAAAYADGNVRVWNPASGQAPLAAYSGMAPPVNGVAFSLDGKLLASADADGTVRLWNPATRQAIGTPLAAHIGYAVNGVAFSPGGKLLAAADADGTVQTWQMPLVADPYAALCADAGSPTKADWTRYAPGEPQPSVCG